MVAVSQGHIMSNRTNNLGPTGQIVMGVVFIIGCCIALLLGMNDLRLARAETAASEWPRVSGTVVHSGVRHLRDSSVPNSRGWVPDVTYTYEVDGEQYSGDRYGFYSSTDEGTMKVSAQKSADNYTEGGTLQVRVDPNDPSNSVIFARKRTPFGSYIAFVVCAAGTVAGIVLIVGGVRTKLGG